jgi:hypothetical protein
LGREVDLDLVAGVDFAGFEDDGHDACVGSPVGGEDGVHELGAETVDLVAGGTVAGDLELRVADREDGAGGEGVEVEVAGGEVFAELAGGQGELVEEFGVEEMDLGEVGSAGVLALQIEVLGGGTGVGVALDAVAGDEVDRGLRGL